MDRNGDLFACQSYKVIQDDPIGFEDLEYLLFKKSINSFSDHGKRMNRYFDPFQDLSKRYQVSITSTFKKILGMVFELVFLNNTDTWNIDPEVLAGVEMDAMKNRKSSQSITLIDDPVNELCFVATFRFPGDAKMEA